MIERIIDWSAKQSIAIVFAVIALLLWSVSNLRDMPLDALPDLSDTQVIIQTNYQGQNPGTVEDQVTWPLSQALLSVPGAKTVRGYSFPSNSFVYVLFDEGTDIYWARSRITEQLAQVRDQLPASVDPKLGPDANGVGWIYQYALVDRTGQHNLAELRSLQDWYLRQGLQSVDGVSEVASVGGMVQQYQVVLNVGRMRIHELSLEVIRQSIIDNNAEVSGSVIELAEAEYMVRGRGYLEGIDDFKEIPYLFRREANVPLQLQDFADIRLGPEQRRGVTDLDGEGEVTGGVVIMRSGANTLNTIAAVKARLEELKKGLPEGVELVDVYDRSTLINGVIDTLGKRILEEFIVVLLVALIFLRSFRAGLIVVLTLPVAILIAMQIMRWQGISANIMSMSGIVIAIGAMMDAVVVIIENVQKKRETAAPNLSLSEQLVLCTTAVKEVARPVFFSLLVVTLGFIPVFALEAQEGRLFTPLAWTKTWSMAAAALAVITLVPALVVLLLRGRAKPEDNISINRYLQAIYRKSLIYVFKKPFLFLVASLAMLLITIIPITQMKTEFMPPLFEGDLLYMPSTQPGISVGRASQLLQFSNQLIKELPEVELVYGKAGRADTATDPAPLSMIETWIKLKPMSQWRDGMTKDKIIEELDEKVQVPGLTNAWLMPITARLAMLETGVKTPLGLRIEGGDLDVLQDLAIQAELILKELPGQKGVFAERPQEGRYIDIEVDRQAAAFHNLNVADVQNMISIAIAGQTIGYTTEGRERYPINIRYPRSVRSSLEQLQALPVFLKTGEQVRLGDVARVTFSNGPSMIRTENANLVSWIHIALNDNDDVQQWVTSATNLLDEKLALPAGYSMSWTGQYQYLERAQERLNLLVPITLILVFVLLSVALNSARQSLLLLACLPFAVMGACWLLWGLGYAISVAVVVGFIALAGIAIEFGMVMLLFLNKEVEQYNPKTKDQWRDCVVEGACGRVRPKTMTIAMLLGGLLPVMLGGGPGSELMQRIAAPMVGGMITAPLISMYLIPVMYFYMNTWTKKDNLEGENNNEINL